MFHPAIPVVDSHRSIPSLFFISSNVKIPLAFRTSMVRQQEKASAGRVFWGKNVNMIPTPLIPLSSRVLRGCLDETKKKNSGSFKQSGFSRPLDHWLETCCYQSCNSKVFTESDPGKIRCLWNLYTFIHRLAVIVYSIVLSSPSYLSLGPKLFLQFFDSTFPKEDPHPSFGKTQ